MTVHDGTKRRPVQQTSTPNQLIPHQEVPPETKSQGLAVPPIPGRAAHCLHVQVRPFRPARVPHAADRLSGLHLVARFHGDSALAHVSQDHVLVVAFPNHDMIAEPVGTVGSERRIVGDVVHRVHDPASTRGE
jgi:hypothetical protein